MSTDADPTARRDVPGLEHAERSAHAERVAPLIDGVEYYRAVRRVLIEAREQVLIVGWDFHSEIDLLRGRELERAKREEDWPVRLADLLERLVERRPELCVYILIWEGSALFAFERQHVPRMKRPWAQHPRIRLVWDGDTPPLGSLHEKIVAVDDRIAFAGGMDLTKARWDDHAHERGDRRRQLPGLFPATGDPYHDLSLVVDGDAARALGDHCRERWRRATGEELREASVTDADPWPDDLEPLLSDRELAFVLTQPAYGEREEKRQVERSFVAQIRSARRLVYIETQYFTHEVVAEALIERLREPGGPEVVLILPFGCPGTVQSMALDPRRDELLERLREADGNSRFGAFWPTLNGGDTEDVFPNSVYVHAKVMVVDDRLLRVGSSNLNHRSMGLDTELDLFLQVDEGEEQRIAGFRRRSLGYLLQVDPERLAQAEHEHGSVLAAIEALRAGRATLEPFDHRADGLVHRIELPLELADPSGPVSEEDAQRILAAIEEHWAPADRMRSLANRTIGALRRSKGPIAGGLVLLALAAAWRWTPLREVVDADALGRWIEVVRASPVGLAGVFAAFVVLTAAGFPVTVLIAAVCAAFDFAVGTSVCALGVAGSSLLGFGIGRRLSSRRRERLLGGRLGRIAQRFDRAGWFAVAVVRNIPVAPYALVNVACGLTALSWSTFLVGTLAGMLPGIALVGFVGQEVGEWLARPESIGLWKIVGMTVLAVGAVVATHFALRRFSNAARDRDERCSGS